MASHNLQDSGGYHITDCLQATLTSLEEEVTRVNTSSMQLKSEIQQLQTTSLRLVDGCDLGILAISKERIYEDTGLNAVRPVV
ncbi:hypothetical protein CABS02_14801 [Colletotrichum abscissum]|uniref:Uncharacterized protein n=1 Tax=Colletotrichum abscissum TaxID=1671311 RepID=A0A9P9X0J6_9PEZI|nr:hypothetical protein CABS02_14801 [Colletotrichum abscissum]